jgi:hypothetical protein
MSLVVYNGCGGLPVFLYTQSSYGSIAQNVVLQPYDTVNMDISSNWAGAINVGTGCNSGGSSCTTGGPTWDGVGFIAILCILSDSFPILNQNTPFSRAEFNFYAIPGAVTYDISLVSHSQNIPAWCNSQGEIAMH